jgi:hypothetical protein
MATVTRYVDPDVSGGAGDGTTWADAYSSLNAWESGEQTNLVTDGDDHIVYVRSSSGTADTTVCGISGWTTGDGNDITIEAASGHEALKTGWSTSRYRLETSNATALWEYDGWVTYKYLQVGKSSSNGDYQRVFELGPAGISNDRIIIGCRFKQASNNSYIEQGIVLADSNCDIVVENSIIYNSGTDADTDNVALLIQDCNTALIYNNDVFDGYYNIKRDAGTVTVKNTNAGTAGQNNFNGTITVDYCCSDDGTGTNSQTPNGADWDNELNDSANGDFTALTGGNIEDNGVGPTSDANVPTTDIDGTTRSGTTCDIGCDEYVSVGGVEMGTLFYHHNQMRH